MKHYIAALVVLLLGGYAFAVVPNCPDYFSYYDCTYQIGDCSACQAYPYAVVYDTGTCDDAEYSTIIEAFALLYPAQSAERRHDQAVMQCMLPTSNISEQDCQNACALKTQGNALEACEAVCATETSFGERLQFIPTACENQFVCTDACESIAYTASYCLSFCAVECPGGLKWGNIRQGNYCGDGVAREREACDDGNNTNGDGCDYNCHQEAIAPTLDPNNPPTDGAGNRLPSTLLNVGPEDDDTLPRQASHKPGTSIRDQLIARNNPGDATPPNVEPKHLPHAGWYVRFQDRLLFLIYGLAAMSGLCLPTKRT